MKGLDVNTVAYMAFAAKEFMSISILIINVVSLRTIGDQIDSVADLKVNRKVFNENLFIFCFFAILTLAESSVALTNIVTGGNTNTVTETRLFQSAYCITSFFYLISYLLYVNILQQVWAYKHDYMFLDPILDREVPLTVYIRNR